MAFFILLVETLFWHAMIVLMPFFAGQVAIVGLVLVLAILNTLAFRLWERRTRPGASAPVGRARGAARIPLPLLGAYVLAARGFCLLTHTPILYAAAHLAPAPMLAACAAAAALPFAGRVAPMGRRPPPRIARGGTIVLAAGWLVIGSFYWVGSERDCARLASQEGFRPLLLQVPCRQFPGWERILDETLGELWEVKVGLGDGKAYVTAGRDLGGISGRVRAFNKIDIVNPAERRWIEHTPADGIAYEPSTDTLFFAAFSTKEVLAVRRATFEATDRTRVGVASTLLEDPAGGRILVPSNTDGPESLFALDPLTRAVTGGIGPAVAVPNLYALSPYRVAVNLEARRIYVSNLVPDITLVEYDYETLVPLRMCSWFVPSRGLAFDRMRDRIYLAISFAGRIDVIEPAGLTRVGAIPSSFGVRDILLDPDRDVLYAGNYMTGEVAALALPRGEKLLSYRVGKKVRGLALDGPSSKLYAVSRYGAFEMDLAPLGRTGQAPPPAPRATSP